MAGARARPSSGGGGGSGGGGAGSNAVLRFQNRLANTYRGETANDYGDISDVGTLYLSNVPMAIAETAQTSFDAATQRPSIIRAIKCIVPGWADIETTDTIRDTFTGWYYLISSLEQEPGLGYYPPRQILTLRMRSGVTVAGEQ